MAMVDIDSCGDNNSSSSSSSSSTRPFSSADDDVDSSSSSSSSSSQRMATLAAFITLAIMTIIATMAILRYYRNHHRRQSPWQVSEDEEEEGEEDGDQPNKMPSTTPTTNQAAVAVQDGDSTKTTTTSMVSQQQQQQQQLKLKLEFLSRYKLQYGYIHSKKGYIDNWRTHEFPLLIPPLKVPSSINGEYCNYVNNDDNHDDDEEDKDRQNVRRPNNVNTDTASATSSDEDTDTTPEREVYLDYAGSALPTKSLLHRIYMHEQQYHQILANPHSFGGGRASDRTITLMKNAEQCVLQHFGVFHNCRAENIGDDGTGDSDGRVERAAAADDDLTNAPSFYPGYQVVFTSGATDSLRLVAERFPWRFTKFTITSSLSSSSHAGSSSSPLSHGIDMTIIDKVGRFDSNGVVDNAPSPSSSSKRVKSIRLSSTLVYPKNVHTSVIGMREIAMQRGCQFRCVSVEELLGASTEWFQNLLRSSVSHDYWEVAGDELHPKQCSYGDEDHERELTLEEMTDLTNLARTNEDESETEASAVCKTIWLHHLLVVPLECNFGGERFDWSNTTAMARKSCITYYLNCYKSRQEARRPCTTMKICHKWHILLDSAKAAATSPVHLPTLAHGGGPDFAVVSFYKLFGAPTGLGALFVKRNHRQNRPNRATLRENRTRESMPLEARLREENGITVKRKVVEGMQLEWSSSPRHYFGGGSVDVVLPEKDYVAARNSSVTTLTEQYEDEHVDLGALIHGSEHFRGIAQLVHGFQEIDDYGGMEKISMHSTCLAAELVRRFAEILHENGSPVVEVYGWKSLTKTSLGMDHGPTVAFNILGSDGSPVGYDEVSKLATINSPPIQIRTGCFCNPGACQSAIKLTNTDVVNNYLFGNVVCGGQRGIVNERPTGAIRASFGKDSTWEDMDALIQFIEKVFARTTKSPPSQSLSKEALYQNTTMRIDSLFVFPIKSCAAMRVNRWPIDPVTGRLAFDREFALVDSSGDAMRLHSYPQMTKICANIDLETRMLTVTSSKHEPLVLRLDIANSTTISPEDIQVCGTFCKGNIWGGAKASRWFSSVLGVRCWLARYHEAGKNNKLSDDKKGHAYCNEASILVLSQQSLSILNSVILSQGTGRLVESRHFRPNIVVSSSEEETGSSEEPGTNPEDSWQRIIIRGNTFDVELYAVGKCARCQMVDIDPKSGMRGNTLRALAQYRRDRGRINFGTFYTGNREHALNEEVWIEEGNNVFIPRL